MKSTTKSLIFLTTFVLVSICVVLPSKLIESITQSKCKYWIEKLVFFNKFKDTVAAGGGGGCNCRWTNGGRNCGGSDGSRCYRVCCGGKRKRSIGIFFLKVIKLKK